MVAEASAAVPGDRAETLKAQVCKAVDQRADRLIQLSRRIHAHPELQFQEHKAAGWLTEVLAEEGFAAQRGCCGMETAFLARYPGGAGPLPEPGPGPGPDQRPVVAFIAEYDALPGMGHACGHNILGSSNVGAGLALKTVMDELAGEVRVYGTPAEEGGGGKIPFVDQGWFQDVTAAITMHPGGGGMGHGVSGACLAVQPLTFKFRGRPAHAAGNPETGVNALDGVIQTFNGINALRQHLKNDVRIHGIITHGGDAVNVVPEYAEASFLVRAAQWEYLVEVVEKVRNCARGGAAAAGAELEIEEGLAYRDVRPNHVLGEAMRANMEHLGMDPSPMPKVVGSYSTDLGNVSHAVPTVSASVSIGGPGVVPHKHEFAAAAGSERGDEAVILAAKVMAMTAVDVLVDESLRRRLSTGDQEDGRTP